MGHLRPIQRGSWHFSVLQAGRLCKSVLYRARQPPRPDSKCLNWLKVAWNVNKTCQLEVWTLPFIHSFIQSELAPVVNKNQIQKVFRQGTASHWKEANAIWFLINPAALDCLLEGPGHKVISPDWQLSQINSTSSTCEHFALNRSVFYSDFFSKKLSLNRNSPRNSI